MCAQCRTAWVRPLWRSLSPTPTQTGMDTNKTLSSWILRILKAADSTTSWDNQLQILMSFVVKYTYEYLPLIFTLHYL